LCITSSAVTSKGIEGITERERAKSHLDKQDRPLKDDKKNKFQEKKGKKQVPHPR